MDDNSVVIEQKRKKSFLVIIITIIALVLAGVGVYYGVIRKNIAFKDFKEAVEDSDFKDANKINKKYNLEDSSKKDECEECLEDAKDGIKDKYFKGDISLEECVKQLDEVSKIGFDMDELDADDIYKLLEEYTLKGSEPEARENVEKPDEKTEEKPEDNQSENQNENPDEKTPDENTPDANNEKGKVYFLNATPEADEAWQQLAREYSDETGVEVNVITAASGYYDKTLESEMQKSQAPTIFQVCGEVTCMTTPGIDDCADKCVDLSDTDLYKNLTSDDYCIKKDGKVLGLATTIDTYGIIVNKKLLEQAGHSVDEIKSFESLKAVAQDITAKKEAGKIKFSAFTCAAMDGSSDWRFKTHLADVPIYFEAKADGARPKETIKGTYLDNYRDIWDLYINNSTADGQDLLTKTLTNSEQEFLDGKAVFFQNGSWEYSVLSNKFSDDDLAMIPIYIGAGDESKQGLCTGSEKYWCINKDAGEANIAASLDFLTWCVTSEYGTRALADDMGFVIPYKDAVESNNVFIRQDAANLEAGLKPVTWFFVDMPSEEWKNGVGTALAAYAAEQTDANWKEVEKAFVDGWASEYAKNH